jgi:heme/copper-type cytochrome/quinol oxidase subunit 2
LILRTVGKLYILCFVIIISFVFQCTVRFASAEDLDSLSFSGKIKNGVRQIEVVAYKYGFFPNPIVVKHGEKVILKITAIDVPHGIRIPEFDINQVLSKGETKTVEFTAFRKGQFMVHCSVYCGPDHGKQKTRLIVKQP